MQFRLLPCVLLLLCCSLALNAYLLVQNGAKQQFGEIQLASTIEQLVSNKPSVESKREQSQQQANAKRIQELQALFDKGEYYTALNGLRSLDSNTTHSLKTLWLQICTEWLLDDPHYSSIDAFLDAGLRLYPNEINFRQLSAERHVSRGEMLKAVDALYKLANDVEPDLQGVFISRVLQVFQQHVKTLSEQQAWQPLVAFTERLLWHEPLHPPYVLVYARAQSRLQSYALAKSSLLGIVHDSYYGAQAQQLIDEIERLSIAETQIPLQAHGSHFLVDGAFNKEQPVKLMIDTGATLSVIDQNTFNEMNLWPEPVFLRNAQINTAGGTVRADVYRVNLFRIEEFVIRDIEFVVMDISPGGGSVGLLGMNFLRHFQFQIDQQYNLLTLSPQR